MSNTDNDPHTLVRAVANHLLAFVIVGGTFTVIGVSILGAVNIENATVALLVGQVIGVCATLASVVVTARFPSGKPLQFGQQNKGEEK